jgi:hypothetical protein
MTTICTTSSLRALIEESSAKFGFDLREARTLHSKLCSSTEPGAPFAAKLVEGIIANCLAAVSGMHELTALASAQVKRHPYTLLGWRARIRLDSPDSPDGSIRPVGTITGVASDDETQVIITFDEPQPVIGADGWTTATRFQVPFINLISCWSPDLPATD